MKRKLTFLLLTFLFGLQCMVAQNIRVTGVVVSQEDGEPIIGASVLVKGTTTGNVTDANGEFSLNAPSNASLIVSYLGMITQEVAVKPTLKIVMRSDTQALDEVVVTALGIKRSEKSLGYAASTINSDDLSQAKSGSVMTGLAGKVAGVSISSSGAGTSQNVFIRGVSSVNSNQPLYIIDGVPMNDLQVSNNVNARSSTADFGNTANDINPDDVETVTVLKGASATALYGSRASNGVIMITTKRAKTEKLTLSYDGSFMASNVLRTMQTQDMFGQGWGSWDRTENGSWGPALDGQMHEWGSTNLSEPMVKPFSYVKDNIRNFYRTGLEMNNNISLRYGTENVGIYASYGNLSSNGILPNDGDKVSRNTFSLRGNAKFDKLTFDMSINYSRKDIRRTEGMAMELLQHAVDVGFNGMQDYNDERYNLDNYYTHYATNPYWVIDNNYFTYQDDHIWGKVELSYDIIPGLKATGRLGADITNYRRENFNAKYSFSPGSYNGDGGASPGLGYYYNFRNNSEMIESMAFLSADYSWKDFTFNGVLGWNLTQTTNGYLTATVSGLDIPGWYDVQNTTSSATTTQQFRRRRLIGLLGQAEIGYKSLAYLTLNARNDWSSTLPKGNNSFFYGGANVSLILSEMIPSLKENTQIDFLKLRAALGKTGNDAGYYLTSGYFIPTYFHYTRLPIGGASGLSENNRLPSQTLKPEMTTEFEFGASANFFKNRLSFDAAYYNRQTKDQIISATLAPETGYTSETKNIGKLENKGIELMVNLTPIRTKDWEWNVGATFTKNWSKVKELWGDTQEYNITYTRSVYLDLKVGEPIGVFSIPAVATVQDQSSPYYGYAIVNNNGFLTQSSTEEKVIGKIEPDFMMGFTTSLKYKNFSFSAVGDWRKGGYMYSGTSYITHFNGNSTQTIYNERNSFVYPNSVKVVGGEYVENNIPVLASQMNYAQGNYSYNPQIRDDMVIPKSYFKLREVALTYNVPTQALEKLPISRLSVSIIGRNLLLFTPKKNNYVDPEGTNMGNDLYAQFGETTGVVTTRNIGGSLKIEF